MVARHGQGFAFGSTPGLADCCLVPQVYSAERYRGGPFALSRHKSRGCGGPGAPRLRRRPPGPTAWRPGEGL